MRTRRIATAALVVSLTALTGCGGSGSGSSTGVPVLSADQLKTAEISLTDLGPGIKVDTSTDTGNGIDLGCLSGVDSLNKPKIKVKSVSKIETKYAADSTIHLPGIFTKVGTFSSQAKAASVLSGFRTAIATCTSVDKTGKDGIHVKVTVEVNSTKAGPAATDQVNLTAVGTASFQGYTFPFGLRFTFIQIGNDVSAAGYVNFGDIGTNAGQVAQLAYERLAAVVDGKTPHPTPLHLHIATESDILGGAGGSGSGQTSTGA